MKKAIAKATPQNIMSPVVSNDEKEEQDNSTILMLEKMWKEKSQQKPTD